MKNLKAKQGYWLSKVDADGTHIFSQDIYAPDSADLSEWQEIEDAEKRKIEAEELAEAQAKMQEELGEEATPMTLELNQIDYEQEVINRIRERYSMDEELAILRQRDTKPQEFSEYFDFCEQVKSDVKQLINN